MILLCALIAGGGTMWAQSYSVVYTLTPSKSTSNTAYASTYDVTIDKITWNAPGNQNFDGYWRIGGKGGSKSSDETTYDRTIQGKTAIGKAISKITINHNGKSNNNVTVNSVTLKVASNSTFTENVQEVVVSSPTVALSTEGSINFVPTLPATEWGKDYYYKFTFNIKIKGSSNYGLDLTSIVFYEFSSDPSSDASFGETSPSISYPTTKTYSQAPTTAEGYTGSITYSMTDNTAGASINSSTGVVTVTKGGTVTVKAVAEAVTGFTASEDTYTLTVNDTRASAALAWSNASADVTYGAGDNVFPTLTNTYGVSVSYTSSNPAAATIDGSGVITLKDVNASSVISAIFEGDDDYKDQTVSYTLNVSKAPFAVKDGVFDFVEAANQKPIEDYGSGMTTVSDGYTTANKTWTAGNVTMVTSKVSGSGYRWWSADGTLRFYNKSTATFSVPSGYVITKIVTTGANFDEANTGTLSSSTWTGASNEVALSATSTRNIKTITVTYTTETQSATVQSYGWATYIPDFNVEFAANTAYVVTAASVSTGLKLAAVTQVPAGTPLLLMGSGVKSATVIGSASAPATNLLSVSNGSALASGEYAYVLAKNGEEACFKQWTGEMSTLKGRVMLVLDEAVAAARSVFYLDDETTGIKQIETSMPFVGGIYNLKGQRVAQPAKGMYIMNGKKVIIK